MSSQQNKKDHINKFIENLNQWVLNIMSGDLSSRINVSESEDLQMF